MSNLKVKNPCKENEQKYKYLDFSSTLKIGIFLSNDRSHNSGLIY